MNSDTEPPAAKCPNNLNIETDPGNDTAVVTWTHAPVIDNSRIDVQLICDRKNGSHFPIWDTLVTCTVVDNFGNIAQCQFTVNVSGMA